MKKWKYAKEKVATPYNFYLRLPEDTPTRLKLKRFETIKKAVEGVYRTVFQADVVEVDGKPVDQLWTIFNYDSVMMMKKKVGKGKGEIEVIVTKKVDEDTMEDRYEIEFVKDEIAKADEASLDVSSPAAPVTLPVQKKAPAKKDKGKKIEKQKRK